MPSELRTHPTRHDGDGGQLPESHYSRASTQPDLLLQHAVLTRDTWLHTPRDTHSAAQQRSQLKIFRVSTNNLQNHHCEALSSLLTF